MTWEADKLYGRQGGRLVAGLPNPDDKTAAYIPTPGPDRLAHHLHHRHGIPLYIINTATTAELDIWHAGEHDAREPGYHRDGTPKNLRHAGHLRHHHQPPPITSPPGARP